MLGCAVGLLLGAAAVSELDAYRLPEEPYFPDGLEPTATQDYGCVQWGQNYETKLKFSDVPKNQLANVL